MAHPAEPIIAAKAEVTVVELLPERWSAVEPWGGIIPSWRGSAIESG